MMMTTSQAVKVHREKLEACMTCPLCNKLFRDATTISECLHTFCRICIFKTIIDEELDSCPVCNTDLGCAPLEKLRADNSLQDLRSKLFPLKRRKAKATKAFSSVQLPARRKERSLSSLVISTPRISATSSMSGKRSKSTPRKNVTQENSTFLDDDPFEKGEDSHESLSSSETLRKISETIRQNFSAAESSKQHKPSKITENNDETLGGRADLWKPLNCLVESASKTKSNKFNSQMTVAKAILQDIHNNRARAPESLFKDNGNVKVHGNGKESTPATSGSAEPRKSQGVRRRRGAASEGTSISAQALVDANSKHAERSTPIWFSLLASVNQEGDAPLPQISSCYLRVKDGSLPVSFIKKYLAQKLDLASESEVELSLRGQPVISTLHLHDLVDWWVQTAPSSERIQTSVGSSGKDFVMVLSYARKTETP